MVIWKKIFCLLFTTMLLIGTLTSVVPYVNIKAEEELGTPKITLKKANGGTGVKITISKTKNADGYCIWISEFNNEYSEYLYDGGKGKRQIGTLKKDGKKKRTYTIKGLPKGTYKIQVSAYTDENWMFNHSFSKEKSIKVKAAKTKTIEEKVYDFSNTKMGDIIKFGSYEQDDNMKNGKEDIEWIVLSKDKDKMLLLSKYVLDVLPYNTSDINENIKWENCSIRKWLNNNFYNAAFSEGEKAIINNTILKKESSELVTSDGYRGEMECGNETADKIFLLSVEDIINSDYGFSSDYISDTNRIGMLTEYALLMTPISYAYFYIQDKNYDGDIASSWWLRSTLKDGLWDVGFIDLEGNVDTRVNPYLIGVRPAMYISFNKDEQ